MSGLNTLMTGGYSIKVVTKYINILKIKYNNLLHFIGGMRMIFNLTTGASGGAETTESSEVLGTFYEPTAIKSNAPITDYKFIYIELMLSGLSVSSRLIPVSRVLYGRRFNVSFNNDLTFYNAQVSFTDANTISCGILQSADMLAVYGVK